MYSYHRTKQKGFTLIELMVSLTVFAIVILISTSTLLTMIDMNAKAQALYSATTNLSFALDSMTREIRMGYHYYCFAVDRNGPDLVPVVSIPAKNATNNCLVSENANGIAFVREKDDKHKAYLLYNGALWQKEEGRSWEQITAPEVVIDDFSLVVENTDIYGLKGIDANNTKQPVVTLRIDGHVNNGLETDTDFHVQTRIMQRRLDIL